MNIIEHFKKQIPEKWTPEDWNINIKVLHSQT
jgi:hypothetical protein